MIRIIYMKTLINTELEFEKLTESEQLDLIAKLVEDHKETYPKNLHLVEIKDYDGSLDW